ncbi:MAG: rRNA adenine dimethyltransferase family protein [Patescibacteria group bacterium]
MIHAKKSLGQNFLKSTKALEATIDCAELNSKDIVLEIGPGKGSLTEKLLEKAGLVIAIEKDDRLIDFLEEKFKTAIKNEKLRIVHADILDLELNSKGIYLDCFAEARKDGFCKAKSVTESEDFCHCEELATKQPRKENLNTKYKILDSKYKIIANIPYYITGQLLRKFLESDFQPKKMVLMVQKEVAERIIDSEKKENLLSLSVKAYGAPKYIKTVKAKDFSPSPKIDSAIILIDAISKDFFKDLDEKKFFKIIKMAFSSKRKVLVNNLSLIPKQELISILEKLNISPKSRAEELHLEDWKKICKEI